MYPGVPESRGRPSNTQGGMPLAQVEDRTAELEETIKGLEADKSRVEEALEAKSQEIRVLHGEVEGLKSALNETENKAEGLAKLAEKAGQVGALSAQVSSFAFLLLPFIFPCFHAACSPTEHV